MKNTIQQFLRDEEGAAAIEYGLLAGLISVMIIAGATLVGSSRSSIFNSINDALATSVTKTGAAS